MGFVAARCHGCRRMDMQERLDCDSASIEETIPSYKEPFGMVFVECMACGCPTIGAKSGGPVEFVKPEQGELVEEEDEWRTEAGARRLGSKLAAAVNTALSDNWRKNKGPGCVKFVEENFSTRAQCEAMLNDMKKWS